MVRNLSRNLLCGVSASVAWLSWAPFAQAGYLQTVVALTGMHAPGKAAGVTYFQLVTPAIINNAGQVGYVARVDGPGIDPATEYGVWSGAPGGIAPAVLGGSFAPGTTGDTRFKTFSKIGLNDSGKVSVNVGLTGNDVDEPDNGNGIWAGAPGAVQYVARIGDPAPGINGATFLPNSMHPAAYNNLGQVGFRASVSGIGINDSNSHAIWVGTPGALSIAARVGSPAPGMPAGVNFGYNAGFTPSLLGPSLSNSGSIAFNASLKGPGITTANDRSLWVGLPNALSLAAREGSAAPGTDPGVVFRELDWEITGNSASQIAFGGQLSGTGVTVDNDFGVWAGPAGTIQLVAREGSQAPGMAPGVHFRSFVGNSSNSFIPSLAENGEVAFATNLRGTGISTNNDLSLWAGLPGSLVNVAQEGQQVPDAAAGVVFSSFGTSTLSINSQGDLAFTASVRGAASFAGIFAWTDGEVHLLVKQGDLIDVGGGVFRTVSELSLFGGVAEGYGSAWNDAGQLVYKVTFTDRSQAIIVTAVPEPGTASLLVVGIVSLAGVAWRRHKTKAIFAG